jgi:6-phosphogluconolactonase (cycloisomerase 2 family)
MFKQQSGRLFDFAKSIWISISHSQKTNNFFIFQIQPENGKAINITCQ